MVVLMTTALVVSAVKRSGIGAAMIASRIGASCPATKITAACQVLGNSYCAPVPHVSASPVRVF